MLVSQESQGTGKTGKTGTGRTVLGVGTDGSSLGTTNAAAGVGEADVQATDSQQAQPPDSQQTQPPELLVGRDLAGRYRIERKLGEGGMGSVYVGRHLTLDKQVAIKVLHAEYARKPELVERFLQEAKSASRIRHENVIDITDFGVTEEGVVFFCMECLNGQDLHELITRAKLEGHLVPWQRTAPIFLQICSALQAAHDEGVIHRDLKPENIFLVEWLGNPDFVKLLDFGIAKMTEVNEEGRKLTKTGMLFGTPEYMSPEQARGEVPDHRVDVYAMGCILFQLVTGNVPFAGETFMAVLSQHLTAEPPTVSAHALARVGAPAALGAVIARALEKDRDVRFLTVRELADAVREVSGGDLTSAEVMATRHRSGWRGSAVMEVPGASARSTPSHHQDEKPGFNRWLLVGGGLLVCLLAILLVMTLGGEDAAEEKEKPSQRVVVPAQDQEPTAVSKRSDTDTGSIKAVTPPSETGATGMGTPRSSEGSRSSTLPNAVDTGVRTVDAGAVADAMANPRPTTADPKPRRKRHGKKKRNGQVKAGDVDIKGFPEL